ncbi:hypothetical protein Taro_023797 [Colocasia esculenta]|uniref:BED-type domain-containing protein n=1 Tax=Colocasia esculenta TaxID=4460 RepID=A0A843VBU8_COLES|nr:hypothetical protein [Colocasia esculenta]
MAAEGGAAPAPHSSSNPPSTDPAWAHGIVVDMARRKVQCKYCDRVLSGGIFRLKQHLAGIKGEVAPCSRVSAEVRMQFCQYMKEKETSKANTSRRRQQIREDLSAPPRRSVDLPRGRQFFDLDQDEEEQFRRASEASRRSNAEEDYLRRTGRHVGQGSGHGGSGQGSSSAGMSSNIPEVPVDIPRDGDPRNGKKVTDIIQSKPFWKGVQNVLNVVEPLVRVLRAVDGERRSEMGYLYEAMDRAKELIQMNNKTTYAKWWEIVDRRWEHTLHHDLHAAGHFFNPQYMYRTDGRRENYDNSSEVLIGAKNVIKRMLDNEDRAIIACKQMHDYRLQLYHFGTSTAQRAAQILSPDIEEVFEEEHPLHAWVNASTSVQPEFDPHDRAWAEGELDDVPLLPEFETPPAPKRQKKTVGARGRSTKHGISIADLDTIEEDIDDETPEPSDNVQYQTSNDSTSKTSTPSEGSDHGGDVLVVSSVPPPAPPPDPIVFTGEEDFTHATQDQHHGSREGREAQTSSQKYARKGKKVASQLQGQGQGQGASEDSGYNPNFIPHRRNWLMKKKKMQEEWERQEKLRMEFETMEQASDTSSYASTEGYYQGQGGYLGYPQYPDASYYTGGGRSTPLLLGQTRSGSARIGRAGLGIAGSDRFWADRSDPDPRDFEPCFPKT